MKYLRVAAIGLLAIIQATKVTRQSEVKSKFILPVPASAS